VRSERNSQISTDEKLKWVERMAKLLDNQYRLPGTNFTFGIDPIVGLIPIVGDIAGGVMSFLLVRTMFQYGASKALIFKMLGNIVLDVLVGSIPVVGGIFDFWFRANKRNVTLLRNYYEYREKRHEDDAD